MTEKHSRLFFEAPGALLSGRLRAKQVLADENTIVRQEGAEERMEKDSFKDREALEAPWIILNSSLSRVLSRRELLIAGKWSRGRIDR